MCAFMRSYYPEALWPELNEKTNAVTTALSDAIVASWRDGYKAPTYYKNKADNIYYDAFSCTTPVTLDNAPDLGAGLTINCSCWVPYGQNGKTYGFEDWYKDELAFGNDCTNWTKLIDLWW